MTYRKQLHTATDMEDQTEQLFTEWWNKEGVRLLNEDNSVPDIEERSKAAFVAGLNATRSDA